MFGKKAIYEDTKLRVLAYEFEEDIKAYANGKISYKQMRNKAYPFELYDAWNKELKNARAFRNERMANNRKLEVVYLTGDSGSGKTLFAKYIADQLKLDYFVSGTGDDILDGYDGEQCIILDDYRAATFKFAEFLKFIDNNTNSSVRSRYYNKDICNCKLIIITSIKRPYELYCNTFDFDNNSSADEQYEQLARRIKHQYFIVDKTNMNIRQSHTTKGSYENFYADLHKIYDYYNIEATVENRDCDSFMNMFADAMVPVDAEVPKKEEENTEIVQPKRITNFVW